MSLFDNMPFSNFHELNTDWILKAMKDLLSEFANWKEDIQNYIINQVPGFIETEVNKQIVDLAISAHVNEDENELAFYIDTGISGREHSVSNETLFINQEV